MSKQEDFRRPEKPLEKMREIDNSVRHPAKLFNILAISHQ